MSPLTGMPAVQPGEETEFLPTEQCLVDHQQDGADLLADERELGDRVAHRHVEHQRSAGVGRAGIVRSIALGAEQRRVGTALLPLGSTRRPGRAVVMNVGRAVRDFIISLTPGADAEPHTVWSDGDLKSRSTRPVSLPSSARAMARLVDTTGRNGESWNPAPRRERRLRRAVRPADG